MEWVDGIKLSTIARRCAPPATTCRRCRQPGPLLPAPGAARRLLPRRHAPGQPVRRRRRHLVAVDFGIIGPARRKERRFLAEILYGFISRDYLRVAEVHFEAGYVPRHHDVAAFAQALRAIGEPILGQPADDDLDGQAADPAFEVTELFDMATRPELVLLQKTMVVVEGVARTLDPASTCGRPPSRWSATGSPAISVRAACWSTRGWRQGAVVARPPGARFRGPHRTAVA